MHTLGVEVVQFFSAVYTATLAMNRHCSAVLITMCQATVITMMMLEFPAHVSAF